MQYVLDTELLSGNISFNPAAVSDNTSLSGTGVVVRALSGDYYGIAYDTLTLAQTLSSLVELDTGGNEIGIDKAYHLQTFVLLDKNGNHTNFTFVSSVSSPALSSDATGLVSFPNQRRLWVLGYV